MFTPGYFTAFKEAVKNLLKKPNTIPFPAENVVVPSNYRGPPTLTPENCTLCNRCVRVCPTWALSIEKIDKDSGTFSIDLGRCCYCQECEKVCPSDAIHLDDKVWLTSGLVRDAVKKSHLVVKQKKEKET